MKKYSEVQKRISMRFLKISGLEALKIYSNRFLGVEKEDLLIHLTLDSVSEAVEGEGVRTLYMTPNCL